MNKILPVIIAMCAMFGFKALAQDPDPNFYIYLCFGQSNMEGNGQIEEIDRNNIPERFKMMAAVNYNNPKRQMYNWYEAMPPLVRESTGLTPVDWFGRTMCDNLPADVRIGVVVVAVGGASIKHLDKDYDVNSLKNEAQWFQWFMAEYDNKPYDRLLACAKEAQKVGVIKGMLLHQGETDNGQQDWPSRVNKVYTDLLTDLDLQAEDVPLFIGETVRSEMGGACGWHNVSVLPNVAKVIPTSHIVSSENLEHKGDGLHFTSHSYRVLGTRYAVEALKLMGIDKPVVNYSDGSVTDPEPVPTDDDYVFDFADFNPSIYGEGRFTTRGNVFIPGEWGCGGWEFEPAIDLSGYHYIVAELKEPQTNHAQLRVWDTPDYFDKSYERDFNNQKLLVCELNGMMKNLDSGIVAINSNSIYRVGIWAYGGEKIRIKHIFATNVDPYNPTGIADVAVDAPVNDDYTVYNLQGLCMLKNADISAVNTLPQGLYIINGRKVLLSSTR